MKTKFHKVLTPTLGLVILLSQGMGVVAMSSDELLEEMGRTQEVVIEYSELAPAHGAMESVTYLSAQQAQTYTATPSSDNTSLNGSPVTMQAYKINGSNYVKLRDFANMVNGTPLNFEVTWDGSLNAINMYTKQAYTPVGGEGTPIGTEEKQATDTTSTIYVNGQVVSLKGYNINNNNYFKLRDLGAALGIGIDWDNATKTVVVDSTGSGANSSVEKPTNQEGTSVTQTPTTDNIRESWEGATIDERIAAGQTTTLDPSDPRHPGWKKNGGFFVATLKPGQEAPANAKGYDMACATGKGSWDGVTVN